MKTLTPKKFVKDSPEGHYFTTQEGFDVYPVGEAALTLIDSGDIVQLDFPAALFKEEVEYCKASVGGSVYWVVM
jgi:hypothetical protein